jgi:hypothetical protein
MHCKQHAEYLQANRGARGAAAEQTQVQGQPSATGTGQLFAEMALVSTKGRPARVIKDWIHLPGYRDAILNPELERVGLFAETEIAVFDVIRGVVPRVGAGRRTPAGCFPAANATGVPTSVELEQLGPEVAALIKEQEVGAKPKGAKIGYPISLHRWRGGSATACTVTANGKPIAGVLHAASGGANRRSSAPGMSVFYPLAPLPKGARIEVVFQVGAQGPSTWSFKTR